MKWELNEMGMKWDQTRMLTELMQDAVSENDAQSDEDLHNKINNVTLGFT